MYEVVHQHFWSCNISWFVADALKTGKELKYLVSIFDFVMRLHVLQRPRG